MVWCSPPLEPGHPPAEEQLRARVPESSSKQQSQGDCRKFGLFLRTFRRESESLPVCSEWAWYSLSQSSEPNRQDPALIFIYFWCLGLNSQPCNAQHKLPRLRATSSSPKGLVLGAPAPSVFAYTLRRLQFSNWISLIWKRVLCGKTLPSDLALIVQGLDTASVRSTPLTFLHLGSLSQHSEAETQTQ